MEKLAGRKIREVDSGIRSNTFSLVVMRSRRPLVVHYEEYDLNCIVEHFSQENVYTRTAIEHLTHMLVHLGKIYVQQMRLQPIQLYLDWLKYSGNANTTQGYTLDIDEIHIGKQASDVALHIKLVLQQIRVDKLHLDFHIGGYWR
jgi:hypothetical protein